MMHKRTWLTLAGHALFIAAFLSFWELAAAQHWVDHSFVGRPSGIIVFLGNGLFVKGLIWREFGSTMLATVIAFGAGSVAAIALGLLFVTEPLLERITDPYLTLINAMPRIALAPLFLLWFGLGMGSKVAVGMSLTFFIVLSSTVAGIRGVSGDLLTLSNVLGATPAQLFIKVTIPSAVPVIFSGLRLGLIYAMLGVVGSELIASEHGLGQLLASLQAGFDVNGVMGLLLLLAAIGLLMTFLMSAIERRLLRWQ